MTDRTESTGTVWRLHEPHGASVILEIVCRDAYAAIEMTEHLASCIEEGQCVLEFVSHD